MKILLLDLDDTLVPSSRAYDAAMAAIALSPTDPLYLQARAEVKARCPAGYPASRSRRIYFKRLLELRGEFTPGRHLQMVQSYEAEVVDSIGHFWQSARRTELMLALKEKFAHIGIVSNEMATMQSAKLAVMDPEWRLFDFIVTSEELGHEKPHPAMFHEALSRVALGADKSVVMVGDNYEFDVAASVSLGFKAIQSTEFVQDSKRHSVVISSLEELRDFPF